MDRKIIFFDIDGTLFDPELGVPQSTRESIKVLIENGHLPVICTGRAMAMVPDYLMEIGFLGIIAGAGTYVEYEGKTVHHKVEGNEFLADILPLLKENHIKFVVEGPKYVYFDSSDVSEEYGFVKEILEKLGADTIKPIHGENIRMNKISCFLTEKSNFEEILPKIQEKFDLIRHQGVNLIELIPTGYNKASGIETLIDYLGIDRKDTYAFGDSTNDLQMLDYVECGIAMGNSYPEVLERAKYRTKSIQEDGIYWGLKKFGLI